MTRHYSQMVNNLLAEDTSILIIPDLIVVKEGIACGDKLILSGQIDNGRLRFEFFSDSACMLCQASCCLCKKMYQDNELEKVQHQVNEACGRSPKELLALFDLDESFSHRVGCISAPFQLLKEWIETFLQTNYDYGIKPDTHGNLECDACVSACRINWDRQERKPITHLRNSGQTGEYLKNWLTLGKIELLPEDIPLLRKMCATMSQEDYQFLSDLTINTFVLHHLIRYAPELITSEWKAAAYLIQKNEINRGYFDRIVRYIHDANMKIYFVKGFVSQQYYDFPSLRIHSDYDIIAESSTDAFLLTSYLMRSGYTIRPNLFSLKKMYYDGREVLSGHFHLQKIIDDTYLLELDISFPGFPINRVELFYPKTTGQTIQLEEQIVITLLHLFKHGDVYMKDLNDLYYMLRLPSLNLDLLREMLNSHRLWRFFTLAVSFIADNYPNGDLLLHQVLVHYGIDKAVLDQYPGWPYDKGAHRMAKQDDFNIRTLSLADNERLYLYPVVMFREPFCLDNVSSVDSHGYQVTQLLNTVFQLERNGYVFFLTPIGILIDSYIDTTSISRVGFLNEIEAFLHLVGNPARHSIPYAVEHFYVRVL